VLLGMLGKIKKFTGNNAPVKFKPLQANGLITLTFKVIVL